MVFTASYVSPPWKKLQSFIPILQVALKKQFQKLWFLLQRLSSVTIDKVRVFAV